MKNWTWRVVGTWPFPTDAVWTLAWLGTCLWLTPAPCHALTELYLVSGNQLIVAADGNVFDQDPRPGVVTLNSAVGSFHVNMTTGYSPPMQGTPQEPALQLVSFHATSQLPGARLQVGFSDKDLGGIPALYQFSSHLSGRTDGRLDYKATYDRDNVHFSFSDTLAEQRRLTGPFAPSLADQQIMTSSTFALTLIVDIEHTAPQQSTEFNASLRGVIVPEPTSASWCVFAYGLLRARGTYHRGCRYAQPPAN